MVKARQPLSLRARAVAWLAQREHSELELRRKLHRLLQAPAHEAEGGLQDAVDDPQAQVDGVIAWLIERGYLDSARFIDSRVHVRAGRFGVTRIQQELARHGLALEPEALRSLRASELERAAVVWARKFSAPPTDARAAAQQARFMANRGFSGEVVRQLLRQVGGGRGVAHEGGDAEEA